MQTTVSLTPPSASLCGFCQRINIQDLKRKDGYTHQPLCSALLLSATTCSLCALIVSAVNRSMYLQRRITDSYHSIEDIAQIGPLRLFGAGREIDEPSRSNKYRSRTQVKGHLLSRNVVIIIGEFQERLNYSSDSPILEMFANQDSYAKQAGVAVCEPIGDDPVCESNLLRTRLWLNICEKSHSVCGNHAGRFRASKPAMPTRLLDIGSIGDSTVKLIETRDCIVENYAALSYCWGTPATGFLTSDSTFVEIRKGVTLDRLARTIQDAVTFLRKLGKTKYLWVDALCIIQDNKEDWKEQASQMGIIYSKAYFTIAATSAKSAADGFISPRINTKVSISFLPERNSDVNGLVHFRERLDIGWDYNEQVENSPLLKRAWVKQERILSCRTIDFSSKQMFWSCRTAVLSEGGQTDNECQASSADFTNALNSLSICQHNDLATKTFRKMFFLAWANLITEYSRLQITRQSDRLPAVAGMMNFAGLKIPGRYFSGIWEVNLADGLFWQPEKRPMHRLESFHIPSWSWASAMSPVSLASHAPEESRIKFVEIITNTIPSPSLEFQGPKALEGRQILRLKGKLQRCRAAIVAEPPRLLCRSERKLQSPPKEQVIHRFMFYSAIGPRVVGKEVENTCVFDGDRGDEEDLFFLNLSCNKAASGMWNGLLLREADIKTRDGKTYYERVGVGWSRDELGHRVKDILIDLV